MTKPNFGTGLKPTPKDDRDFGLIEIYTQPDISEVPNTDWSFWEPMEIKNQRQTQECTGHGVAAALEAHEGVIINPSLQYAFIKELVGDPTDSGADLRTAMKSGVKIGGVEKSDCNIGTADYDGDFLADIKNYPADAKDKAKPHQQRSYFSADRGRYDRFDNFRTWLWKFRNERPVIVTGVAWEDTWTGAPDGVIPKEPGEKVGGHCIVFLPKQKIINGEAYLGVQNSYSEDVGDKGIFWFPREVINRDFTFDGFIYRDKDPEEVKQLRKGDNMEEAEPSVRSDLFNLNLHDVGKGALVAVISAVLVFLQNAVSTHGLALTLDDVKTMVSLALTAGLGYLVKNMFEDQNGDNKIVGSIKRVFKKK